jgi:DNA modification methylase
VTATVLRGDARNLPLPDASVDLIVTSPPYWSLRSYLDNGEHYDGQIGAEATPAAYIDSLIDCTREWVRVLKPTGSRCVNLGDKYST